MFLSLLGGIASTAIAQVGTPMTADYACWMIDASGQMIDMSHLCEVAAPITAATPESSAAPQTETVIALPLAGTRCYDFATQEEVQYHFFLGTASASLDRDNDGTACEVLRGSPNRIGGSRVGSYRSTRYAGVEIELFDVGLRNIDGDFYLRVTAPGLGIFTTRNFANKSDALEHMRLYYGYTQGL